MGYDLHITRADHWPDSAIYPISLQEWIAVADDEPRLEKHQPDDRPPVYGYLDSEGRGWALSWREGLITVWKGYEAAAALAVLAEKLGARLVGDDSEEYYADGSSAAWTEPRPILFHRRLNLDETAAAWEAIFERQGGCFASWQPSPDHARHAFAAFRAFAGHAVVAEDVPDADGLLYQYGPVGSEGEPVFRLSFVRQLATDADGGLAQTECRLDYAMTPELADLGTFHTWWFAARGTQRDAWFDALADRPEWRLLNALAPVAYAFGTDHVC